MKPEIEADSAWGYYLTFSEKCLERRLCGNSLGKCPKRGDSFDSARDDGSMLTYCWGSDSAGEKDSVGNK